MLIAVFVLRGTHCFYIQSDIFTMASIAVFLQYLYLIKACPLQVLNRSHLPDPVLPGCLLLLPVRKNLLPDVRSMVLLNI